ncbi:retinaldehyde-binding protein 1-like [Galleria mellonella]|uniref:Alpha-tocopherol transfer protein-like n=1 Tax=Galleria mellonella TaxID=7137 RepID=A0A6J1WYB8_GALME|nr:retinaldehyde-binding protein 1-like [Galleria mellonella]XP_026757880.1 retinaldehyde-binding protein 1-like [Galleria mellonella]
MTTASVLLTVATTWNVASDKVDKSRIARTTQSLAAEAAKELRETTATREQALRIMRDWIQKNNDIKNVRQDDAFLLRFLRHKKYSVPMAQQTLLKYLNLRKYYPEIFLNVDCEDQNLQEIINNGYLAVSPVRDSKGRRVIVYNMSKFNANKLTCWDMCRVHTLIYESLLEDPIDQICGFTHVGDGSGVTGAHITAWNPTDFARLMKWGEQSMPMRHKEFHLINIPTAIKYIIDFAKSKVTAKMAARLQIHSSLKQLHKNVDVACLPTIYGGEIPLQDMITFTKQLISDQRKTVLNLDDMQILSTRGIISSRSKNNIQNDSVSVEGSFRKLEID